MGQDGLIPGIPTTIKAMGVNITTIVYLRVLIIQIGSTIILMVVEAQGNGIYIVIDYNPEKQTHSIHGNGIIYLHDLHE